MNDRHLFRGKHTDGRWKTWLAINGAVQAWEILSDTIGQCTGLKDRNGKLIFEGDIILKVTEAVDVSVPYYVYQNHCGQYILHRSKDYISALDARLSDGDDYEIIGNIHDNPELLATEIESDLPAAGGGIKMEMRSCKNCEHKALEAKTKHKICTFEFEPDLLEKLEFNFHLLEEFEDNRPYYVDDDYWCGQWQEKIKKSKALGEEEKQ